MPDKGKNMEYKFKIQDREAGNEIEKFETREKAQKELEKYETDDKKEETYTHNFYEIVEIDPTTTTDMYMNPVSGSVQNWSDWQFDQKAEGWNKTELKSLIKVKKDKDGSWIEV